MAIDLAEAPAVVIDDVRGLAARGLSDRTIAHAIQHFRDLDITPYQTRRVRLDNGITPGVTPAQMWTSEEWSAIHAKRTDWVPVAPFRERFLQLRAEGRIGAAMVARELGWYRNTPPSIRRRRPNAPDKILDLRRVARTLGMCTYSSRGKRIRNERIKLATAESLARVLALDPWEAGL